MITPAGKPATLYDPNGQQHVFFRATDNGIYQVFYDPSTNNVHGPEQWDSDQTGNFVLGNPATMSTPNQQHVFHVNSFGSIKHIYYDYTTGRAPIEQWVSGAAIGSTPATMFEPNGQQHVFYRGADTNIYQVYYDPRSPDGGTGVTPLGVSGPEVWAPEALSNPATMYTPNQQHMFYRDFNGYIWQVYYDESASKRRGPEQWVGPQVLTTDILAVGDPASLYIPNGQQHIFYRGTDSDIYHVFYDPSTNSLHGPEKWVVGAGGDPAAMYTLNGQQHIFNRGGGDNINKIFHLYYDPASNSLRDDGIWASGAASDPATMYIPANGQQHIFYRGTDNGIYNVFYDPATNSLRGPEKWV